MNINAFALASSYLGIFKVKFSHLLKKITISTKCGDIKTRKDQHEVYMSYLGNQSINSYYYSNHQQTVVKMGKTGGKGTGNRQKMIGKRISSS